MNHRNSALSPRKTPVQVRSANTVEAVFDATIQVLLNGGMARLTTTRVAERAGVSVGTLYQYFPNKQALLAAVLERHLSQVLVAVEVACALAKGRTVEEMAAGIVNAFMDAKFAHPEVSRALYAVAAEVGGDELVVRTSQRSQITLCDVLATASNRRFDQLTTVSYVVATCLVGPVQGLLASFAPIEIIDAVRLQLHKLLAAYLLQVGIII